MNQSQISETNHLPRSTEIEEPKTQFSWEEFPKYMRAIGAIALIASAATFLFQGYLQLSSFMRFLAFFGMVGGLGVAGFACLRMLDEVKGARTFMALLTAGVPVLFAQLGAMIFYFATKAPSQLPDLLKFSAGLSEIAIAGGMLAAVMAPAAFAGMRILARDRAGVLSATFIGFNALLLVPTRAPEVTATLLAAGSVLATYIVSRSANDRIRSSTFESKLAHIIMAVPLLILAMRGLFYDEFSMVLVTTSAAIGFAALMASHFDGTDTKAESKLQAFGMTAISIAYAILTTELTFVFRVASWARIEAIFLGVGLILVFAYSIGAVRSRGYLRFGSLVAGICASFNALFNCNLATASIVTILAAILLIISYRSRDKITFDAGVMTLFAALFSNIWLGLDYFSSWPWITLGVLGASVIFAASWLESRRGDVMSKVKIFMASLN